MKQWPAQLEGRQRNGVRESKESGQCQCRQVKHLKCFPTKRKNWPWVPDSSLQDPLGEGERSHLYTLPTRLSDNSETLGLSGEGASASPQAAAAFFSHGKENRAVNRGEGFKPQARKGDGLGGGRWMTPPRTVTPALLQIDLFFFSFGASSYMNVR